jgi:hypothetical protein
MEQLQKPDLLALDIILKQLVARHLALVAQTGRSAETERTGMLKQSLEMASLRAIALAASDKETDRLSERRCFRVSREIEHFFGTLEAYARPPHA